MGLGWMRLIVFLVAIAVVISPVVVVAEEDAEKPTAGADVGIFSKYIWRGFELSDDSIVIQPSVSVGYKGFGMNLWGNLDTDFDDGSNNANFNETDLTLSYDTSIGPMNVGVGYIYYGLDGVDDSQEVYLSLGFESFLSPTLTIYREIAHYPGWYLNFGVSHSFDLPKGVTLDLGGSVGYYRYVDDSIVEVDDNLNPTNKIYRNLHDGMLSAGLTIPLCEYLTLSPVVTYSFPLTSEADNYIRSSSFSDDSDFFFGGVTLSLAF